MKKYQDYKKNKTKFIKYKIVVPTKKDKKELEDAFEHFHYSSDVDTDYIVVNQLIHEYLGLNNIIVDKKLFNKLRAKNKK